MVYIITLVNEDQNYVDFHIEDGLIIRVSPCFLPGWEGTRVLNRSFSPGGELEVQFHNGYDMPLPHLIAAVMGPL